MKKYKKLLSVLCVLCVVMSLSVPAFAASDLDEIEASTSSVDTPSTEVDSSPLNPFVRSTLTWSDQTIAYNTRMRFVSSYTGGYFTLDGVTATFTVSLTNGASENIQIDWYDSNGNSTVLYTGSTSSKTVSYTVSGRESGNFRVWNKSASAITVDASISY